jgi:hypothetical protein
MSPFTKRIVLSVIIMPAVIVSDAIPGFKVSYLDISNVFEIRRDSLTPELDAKMRSTSLVLPAKLALRVSVEAPVRKAFDRATGQSTWA